MMSFLNGLCNVSFKHPLVVVFTSYLSTFVVSEPNNPSISEDDKRTDSPRTQPTRSLSSAMSQTIDPENWAALELDVFLPPLKVGSFCLLENELQ